MDKRNVWVVGTLAYLCNPELGGPVGDGARLQTDWQRHYHTQVCKLIHDSSENKKKTEKRNVEITIPTEQRSE